MICLMDFADGDEVTPLKCHIQHTFHSDCITNWFQQNLCCPACKVRVSVEDMHAIKQDMESTLERLGREYDERCGDAEAPAPPTSSPFQ